jgi:uncharacterized protein (TIGR02001 family)
MRAQGILLFVVNALAIAGPAAGEGRWSGFVAGTTDYIYRGATQTRGQPALQGDLHYETSAGGFLGVWASTARPSSDVHGMVELNAYAGQSWLVTADWHIKMTGVHYTYIDDPRSRSRDFNEIVGSLAFRDRLYATVAWSPDTSRYSTSYATPRRSAISYELATHVPFATEWYLSGGAGYYDLTAIFPRGYWFWNAGLGVAMRRYEIDLSYFGTDSTARSLLDEGAAGDRWALTLSWRF